MLLFLPRRPPPRHLLLPCLSISNTSLNSPLLTSTTSANNNDLADATLLAKEIRDCGETLPVYTPVFRLGCLPYVPPQFNTFSALATMRSVLPAVVFERLTRFVTLDSPDAFRAVESLPLTWNNASWFRLDESKWNPEEGQQPLLHRVKPMDSELVFDQTQSNEYLGGGGIWRSNAEEALASRMAMWGILGGVGSVVAEAHAILALRMAYRGVSPRLPCREPNLDEAQRLVRTTLTARQRIIVKEILAAAPVKSSTLNELLYEFRSKIGSKAVDLLAPFFVPNLDAITPASIIADTITQPFDYAHKRDGTLDKNIAQFFISATVPPNGSQEKSTVMMWGLPPLTTKEDLLDLMPIFDAKVKDVQFVADLSLEGVLFSF